MKQMTCTQMGGPDGCTATITGNTPDEMVKNGMKHVEKVHPEMAEKIKAMSKGETEKWMADFKKTWESAPDM